LSRLSSLCAAVVACALAGPAAAEPAPSPEPSFGSPALETERCADQTYPECRRLRFAYGPIEVTPGNNAQYVGPVTIEKPAYDGYAIRTVSNLVRGDGSIPPVDVLHLHHGVWISVPQRGSYLPFYGAGEEKTAAISPPGYGMLVKGSDVWLLNYMLHNQTTVPESVWITYDIDYVPREAAERAGIKGVLPLWLDVRNADRPYYPVFNVQRGFGSRNAQSGRRECTYPRETCATVDPYGKSQQGNGRGYDWTVPPQFAGTLVGIAGHLHPGGLRDEVDLVRTVDGSERVRRIFTSEAVYFDPRGPISWDMAMTVSKRDWRVQVEPGDRLRLNAVYDAEQSSWYEGMGIVMAFVAPGERTGVNPFDTVRKRVKVKVKSRRKKARTRRTRAVRGRDSARRVRARARRRARYRWVWRNVPVPIETTGQVTHGHLAENDNYGGEGIRSLPAKDGPVVSEVQVGNYQYSPGDLSRAEADGIPRVRADGTLTFRNWDASLGVWHSITTCAPPCTGRTGISYPLADGDPPLDSLELGWVPPPINTMQPTSQSAEYKVKPREAGLVPGQTYTYFCRVHPFMRGGFKVVE
jgi:hypothetical protein